MNQRYFDVLRRVNPRIIIDFDDAIHVPQTYAHELGLATQRFGLFHFEHMLQTCRHVVVCNAMLAAFAAHYSRRVSMLPTVVDTNVYRPVSKGDSSQVILGWVGSASTLPYLRVLEPVFTQLERRHGDQIALMVVCDKPYVSESGIDVHNVPWSLSEEVQAIQRFDIGLMPLVDDPWSRGKCGFKAIQCMAVATPVVASPVGMNTQLIDDDHNGFTAATEDEWVDKITLLIDDATLRANLGYNARHTIEESYSVSFALPRLLKVLQAVSCE